MYLKKKKREAKEQKKIRNKKGSDSSLENVNNKSQNENTYCGPDKEKKKVKKNEWKSQGIALLRVALFSTTINQRFATYFSFHVFSFLFTPLIILTI